MRLDLELPYSRVAEIAENANVNEANHLLQNGWALIKAVERLGIDEQGHQITTVIYILGRLKESQRRKSTQQEQQRQLGTVRDCPNSTTRTAQEQNQIKSARSLIPEILALSIQWRQKNEENKNFYYAFVHTLEGKPDPIISPVVKVISENHGAIVQDSWRFSISKNGQFLQRSKVNGDKAEQLKK